MAAANCGLYLLDLAAADHERSPVLPPEAQEEECIQPGEDRLDPDWRVAAFAARLVSRPD